jgi:hypothetical protein
MQDTRPSDVRAPGSVHSKQLRMGRILRLFISHSIRLGAAAHLLAVRSVHRHPSCFYTTTTSIWRD